MTSLRVRFATALSLPLVLCPSLLLAQLQTGNLYGTVTDTEGEPLPGVELTLTGVGSQRCQTSNERGQIRFRGLDPGTYEIVAELEGYTPVVFESVDIRVGRNTTIQLQMSSALEETITVTTEPPLMDGQHTSSGLHVTRTELDVIPTARDPWAIIEQAPGVILDRVNVGGSESGQQAVFVGPGSSSTENAYLIEGVNITDMAAVGASPSYFDFEQLGEMQVTVGGADVEVANSGVTVNLVTRRGSNRWRASARYFLTDDGWQAASDVDPGDFAPGQAGTSTNRVRGLDEYGAEAGGPLVAERLWVWGAYGASDIDRTTLGGHADDIELENWALKLNGDASPSNSAVASVHRSDKERLGRGASVKRSTESLWDQKGGTDFFKVEDTHIFTPSLYLTGFYSVVDGDWSLTPRGGRDAEIFQDANGVWQGGYVHLTDSRDMEQWQLEGSFFVDTLRTDHEVTLGAGLRRFEFAGTSRWGPRNLLQIAAENVGGEYSLIQAFRQTSPEVEQSYTSLWGRDTVRRGRFTLNLGLRYDLQEATNRPSEVEPNPVFPELLEGHRFPGADAGFSWGHLAPRLSLAYSVPPAHETLIRVSYGRYQSQLHTELAARVNPAWYSGARLAFEDLDGDHVFEETEPVRLLTTFEPAMNLNDPGLEPEITEEYILGIEHSPRPSLVVGADLIFRQISGVLESRRLVEDPRGEVRQAVRDDYVLDRFETGRLPDGGRFEEPVFSLEPDLRSTGGSLLTNGDRRQEYSGISLFMTRRLLAGWMVRGHVTLNDWRWRVGPEFFFHDDPTDLALSTGEDGLVSTVDTDGEVVAEPFRGDRDGVFLNSRWSFNVSGLYRVAPSRPWGFTLAANLRGREGFPLPYSVATVGEDGIFRMVQVTPKGDSFRSDDVVVTDLRVEKEVKIGDLSTVFSIDVFNALNEAFVLERSLQLNGPQPDFLEQTLSPRVLRFGVRLHWR